MALVNKDTNKGKGIRTAYQAVGGAIVSYAATIAAIPEVREATALLAQDVGLILVGWLVGSSAVAAGLISWYQNRQGR